MIKIARPKGFLVKWGRFKIKKNQPDHKKCDRDYEKRTSTTTIKRLIDLLKMSDLDFGEKRSPRSSKKCQLDQNRNHDFDPKNHLTKTLKIPTLYHHTLLLSTMIVDSNFSFTF